MQTIQENTYGGTIQARNDNDGFDVYFLYNMGGSVNRSGDVWDRKTYKSHKTAVKRIEAFIAEQSQ